MRLFRLRGGIHPAGHKEAAGCAIRPMPMPRHLYVPLQQHIGTPAAPAVGAGERVLKGQVLGHSQGFVSAPVHAPTSGTVLAVTDYPAPHPSGLPLPTVILEADGEDAWLEVSIPRDPFDLEPEEVADRVAHAGIVGLGGATFPSAPKLNLGLKCKARTLIINGAECEPYLTCNDRQMRERPAEVVDGIRILLHALQGERALIGIEDNKPEAIVALRTACASYPQLQVVALPTHYPMGSEKQLVKVLTGREVPAAARPADIGVLVHNVATACAVHEAVRLGRPLISRIITVAGGAVREPMNLEVPIGALVADMLACCGGLAEEPARLLMGGPLMGHALPRSDVPVVKGTSGIIALSARELAGRPPMPCIRCGRCVQACPMGLMPLELMARARANDLDGALAHGLSDCIACGSCAYVCPAHIPLVHYFHYAKGQLANREQARQKAEVTRQLAEERRLRLEREAAARAARPRVVKVPKKAGEASP